MQFHSSSSYMVIWSVLTCLDPYDCAITYASSTALLPFPLVNLLAGKCNLAIRGRGARDFWSNPLTQTNPAICHQIVVRKQRILEMTEHLDIVQVLERLGVTLKKRKRKF